MQANRSSITQNVWRGALQDLFLTLEIAAADFAAGDAAECPVLEVIASEWTYKQKRTDPVPVFVASLLKCFLEKMVTKKKSLLRL